MRFLIVLLTCIYFTNALSQTFQELDILDLKSPLAPGFTVLDVTPESINIPYTPRAITVSGLNDFQNNYGLPTNYSLEIAPYWFSNKKNKSFERFFGIKEINYAVLDSLNTNPLKKILYQRRYCNNTNYWKKSTNPAENTLAQNIFAQAKLSSFSFAYVSNYYAYNNTVYTHSFSGGLRVPLLTIRDKHAKKAFLDAKETYLSKLPQHVKLAELNEEDKLKVINENVVNAYNKNLSKILLIASIDTNSFYEEDYCYLNNQSESVIYPIFYSCDEFSYLKLIEALYNIKDNPGLFKLHTSDLQSVYDQLKLNANNDCGINNCSLLSTLFPDFSIQDSLTKERIIDLINTDKTILEEALNRPPLFRMELSGAIAAFFPEDNFKSKQLGRGGLWLTSEFNFGQPQTDKRFQSACVLVLNRFLYHNLQPNSSPIAERDLYFDNGIKAQINFKNFSMGIESIYRFESYKNSLDIKNTKNNYRLCGNMNIKVNNQFNISAAFGRNFNERHNIISVLGIDWNILNKQNQVSDQYEEVEMYQYNSTGNCTY